MRCAREELSCRLFSCDKTLWASIFLTPRNAQPPMNNSLRLMKTMNTPIISARLALLGGAMLWTAGSVFAASTPNPFVGHWALTIPGGAAGWLGVTESQGNLSASLLWGGGSVLPVQTVKINEGVLELTRQSGVQRRKADGAAVTTETITAKLDGDPLKLKTVKHRPNQP